MLRHLKFEFCVQVHLRIHQFCRQVQPKSVRPFLKDVLDIPAKPVDINCLKHKLITFIAAEKDTGNNSKFIDKH